MNRPFLSTVLTLALGVAGGAAGARLFPADAPVPNPLSPAPAHAALPPEARGTDAIADLVDRVKGAVVNIDTVSHRQAPNSQAELFRRYFEGDAPMAPQEQKGVGSGFVVRQDGLIVTNRHVIAGADALTVTFADGRKLKGKVVGQDPGTDLALVRVDAKGLPTLSLADPAKLRVGQTVVAMGSPLGLSQTVTAGILSAIDRDIALNARVGFLQTDAPINPGNSGGPLMNLRGEVVGVNTAIAARGQGIGFAVPVSVLSTVIPQLEAKGKVERAWLGVGVTDLPEDRSQMFYPVEGGALVGKVDPKGPAAGIGLKPGDVITAVAGEKIANAAGLIREIGKHAIGETIALTVNRNGQEKRLSLKLAGMPQEVSAALAQDGE